MRKKPSSNQPKISKKEQRRQQVAKEKRAKNLKLLIPVVAIVAVIGGFLLARAIQPEVEGTTVISSAPGNQHDAELTFAGGGLPPMGGPHNPSWLNCGIYDQPVPVEKAIHSMEHGAVWITYRLDLPADEVAELQEIVRGETFLLLSPYEGQEQPIMLTAWGLQLAVDSANDGRIEDFIERYRLGSQTPELGGVCIQGVGVPIP